jgi:hypothetical protein
MGKRTMKRALIASTASILLIAGCGAGGSDDGGFTVRPDPEAPGAPPGDPAPTDPSAPTTGTGGPDFNVSDESDDGLQPQGCQQAERKFEPNIPTVYLLVDRSGTMFDPVFDNVSAWTALRGGVLQVMGELESNVRFGFAAFSGADQGVVGNVQQCELEQPSVLPNLNNYAPVAGLYESLERPLDPNSKETPTLLALTQVAAQLRADTAAGDKYILFVTDGEPDYCNNGNPICPPDSVVGLLQKLSSDVDAAGAPQTPIRTMVFGVSSPTASIRLEILQAFANAGAGLPVARPAQNANEAADPNYIYDQCNGVPGWQLDFATTGKPAARGQTIGDYVTDPALGGNAPVFRPDPTDQAALTDQIRTALAGVKSCTFDLSEDGVLVDVTRQDLGEKARVIVNGSAVPFDAVNGWSMSSQTAVTLAGQACDAWRNPTIQTSISFDFPCDIFVPR